MSWLCLPRSRRVTAIHSDAESDEQPRIIKVQTSQYEHRAQTSVTSGEHASIEEDCVSTAKEIQIITPADEDDSDENDSRRIVKRIHYRRGVHWKEPMKPL